MLDLSVLVYVSARQRAVLTYLPARKPCPAYPVTITHVVSARNMIVLARPTHVLFV